MPGLERVEVPAPAAAMPQPQEHPKITMAWDEAVHERLVCFAEGVVGGWYAEATGAAGTATAFQVTRDSVLESVAFLDREDLVKAVALPDALTTAVMDKMRVLSEVSHSIVQTLEKDKRITLLLATRGDLYRPITCFSLEFSGNMQGKENLLDPGRYDGVDEMKQFAALRRAYTEKGSAFERYWMKLTEAAQRDALFRAAPLSLDDSDETFPVCKTLLPGITVVNLMGAGLMHLFQQRVTSKFRIVAAAELQHAVTIVSQFADRYPGKLFSSERRKLVNAHKVPADVAAKLMQGRLYGVYHAKICSVQALLQALLDNRDKERERARLAKRRRQTLCDACGVFSAKLMLCSRCKSRRYCCAHCQKEDWKTHNNTCGVTALIKFATDEDDE